MKLDEQICKRLTALIGKGEAALATHTPNPPGYIGFATLDSRRYPEWRNQALVCLEQVFGSEHTYATSFRSRTKRGAYQSCANAGLGILRAALEDVERGDLETLQQMAAADVVSDFLDQADHLLENGYVAPAASLAGAVLENGLRSLAERNDITVNARDNLSALNSKIGGKGVYNRLRQKQVSVWIEVRDNADHGHFGKLAEADVVDLITGVRNFLAEQA